jgi:hypothetical protein
LRSSIREVDVEKHATGLNIEEDIDNTAERTRGREYNIVLMGILSIFDVEGQGATTCTGNAENLLLTSSSSCSAGIRLFELPFCTFAEKAARRE